VNSPTVDVVVGVCIWFMAFLLEGSS